MNRKLKQNQKGLAAIELTLILPILLLFLFATVEFSRLLYQYNALTKVVRNATRYMSNNALTGANIIDPDIIDSANIITGNTIYMLAYGDLAGTTEILPNLSATTFSVSVTNEFITVTASYPWQPIFSSTLPSFVSDSSFDLSFPLVTTYTMRAIQ